MIGSLIFEYSPIYHKHGKDIPYAVSAGHDQSNVVQRFRYVEERWSVEDMNLAFAALWRMSIYRLYGIALINTIPLQNV